MAKTYQRVRNHIVTGLIFVMPVLICLVVLSQFWKHMLKVGGLLSRGSGLIPFWGRPAMLVRIQDMWEPRKLGIDSVELDAHLNEFGKGILTAHARPGARSQ